MSSRAVFTIFLLTCDENTRVIAARGAAQETWCVRVWVLGSRSAVALSLRGKGSGFVDLQTYEGNAPLRSFFHHPHF